MNENRYLFVTPYNVWKLEYRTYPKGFSPYKNGRLILPPEDIRLKLIVNNENLNFDQKVLEIKRINTLITREGRVLTYEKR